MRAIPAVLIPVLLAALSVPASGQVVVDLVGDEDCFGLEGECPDGTNWRDDLGGSFFSDYRDAGDPAFTDQWFSEADIMYTHSYTLPGSPLSSFLTIRTAGIADSRGPWDVFFNGFLAGQFPTNTSGDAFQEIITHTFSINTAWLTGSDDILLAINTPTITDGYSIDYAELTIRTGTAVAVAPEPLSVVLMGTGLLGVALMSRRRGRPGTDEHEQG